MSRQKQKKRSLQDPNFYISNCRLQRWGIKKDVWLSFSNERITIRGAGLYRELGMEFPIWVDSIKAVLRSTPSIFAKLLVGTGFVRYKIQNATGGSEVLFVPSEDAVFFEEWVAGIGRKVE